MTVFSGVLMSSDAKPINEKNSETPSKTPKIWVKSRKLSDEYVITLFVVEFDNWVLAFAYNEVPLMGAPTLSLPQPITQANLNPLQTPVSNPLSNALGEIFAKKLGKPCIASINLENETPAFLNIIHQLIQDYMKEKK